MTLLGNRVSEDIISEDGDLRMGSKSNDCCFYKAMRQTFGYRDWSDVSTS